MPVDPARRSQGGRDRRALLQGVYDDNLRVLDRVAATPARPSSAPKRRPPALSLLGGVGLLLAVVLAGVVSSDARREAAGGVTAALATPSVAAGQQAWALPEPPRRGGDRTTADLYGLEVRTIVLDPGHGGRDPGAIGRGGTLEKDVTLEVALRLRRRLARYPGYRILLTREEDTWVTKNDRAAFANDHGADLFISLHFNAIADEAVASIETYYFGSTTDEATLRKVERENRESGYSMAEFREMVQRLATDIKLEESKRLATEIQGSLYANARLTNPAVRNWGVKTAPFVVLLGVKAPSVLAEIACISNPEEEARLRDPEHLENLAAFLEEGIVRYLQPSPSGTALPTPAPGYATEEE